MSAITAPATTVALAAGTEVDLAAGAEVALAAGTEVDLAAGAEVALVAGTQVTLATGAAVIVQGAQDGGSVVAVPVTSDGHLEVAIHEPVTAFGEVLVAAGTPRVQIDAPYGLLTTDTETLLGVPSGTATAASSLFTVTSGTAVGGYGVVRSRRIVRYRPGQGIRLLFTAMFPTAGVANCLLLAGGFNAEDGLFIGYSGTAFGFMRRVAGATCIVRLTVTVGSSGAETVTITLNGIAYTLATGGALSTTALAEAIAERAGTYYDVATQAGWSSGVSPTSNGATVTFIQQTPAAAAGAYTMTSTGAAAGTFATIQAGAANNSSTGFVAQTAWNVDRLNGAGGALNPSGVLLDPAKLNVWEIRFGYLGASSIWLRYMTPNGEFNTVHRINYPNSATIPSFRNPTMRLGWVAASVGSTTDLTTRGSSAAGFVDGPILPARDPYSKANNNYSASTTEYVALVIRSRGEFAAVLNQREVEILRVRISCETASRILTARIVLNPTMTGAVNWGYVNQSLSSVEFATPTNVAASGGSEVGGLETGTSDAVSFDLSVLRMEPGDTLAVCVATVSASATATARIDWLER